MKIYTLIDNIPYAPEYDAEHGLSLYIETAQCHILFDFGQTAALSQPICLLGVSQRKK